MSKFDDNWKNDINPESSTNLLFLKDNSTCLLSPIRKELNSSSQLLSIDNSQLLTPDSFSKKKHNDISQNEIGSYTPLTPQQLTQKSQKDSVKSNLFDSQSSSSVNKVMKNLNQMSLSNFELPTSNQVQIPSLPLSGIQIPFSPVNRDNFNVFPNSSDDQSQKLQVTPLLPTNVQSLSSLQSGIQAQNSLSTSDFLASIDKDILATPDSFKSKVNSSKEESYKESEKENIAGSFDPSVEFRLQPSKPEQPEQTDPSKLPPIGVFWDIENCQVSYCLFFMYQKLNFIF